MTREKEYLKRKQQRAERRAQGLCTRCGVPLEDARYVQCERCRKAFQLNWYPMSTRGSHARPMADRGKNGDCWRCGQLLPQDYHKKICPECISKALKAKEAKKHENISERPHNQ